MFCSSPENTIILVLESYDIVQIVGTRHNRFATINTHSHVIYLFPQVYSWLLYERQRNNCVFFSPSHAHTKIQVWESCGIVQIVGTRQNICAAINTLSHILDIFPHVCSWLLYKWKNNVHPMFERSFLLF